MLTIFHRIQRKKQELTSKLAEIYQFPVIFSETNSCPSFCHVSCIRNDSSVFALLRSSNALRDASVPAKSSGNQTSIAGCSSPLWWSNMPGNQQQSFVGRLSQPMLPLNHHCPWPTINSSDGMPQPRKNLMKNTWFYFIWQRKNTIPFILNTL